VDIALTSSRAALDALFARTTGGTKFGLDRTYALLASVGDPQLRFPAFHVGGTNGKGSVVATLDALLRARGLRVGRYTSPHLIDFRERILIDGTPVSDEEVTEWIARWMPEVERLGATFFEATTAMAFDLISRAGVDVALVEVGLGGRLDSTNVLTPLVAAVTSIGFDHMEFLGDTLEQIADEKAGIFKAEVPAVIGEPDEHIRHRLARRAREAGASPIHVVAERDMITDVSVAKEGTSFTLRRDARARRLTTPLIGAYQASNTAVALAMLEAAGGTYAKAAGDAERHLGEIVIGGRFDRRGSLVFDVAHNPPAVAVLCETLAAIAPPRPIVALVAVLRDKDWRAMLELLSAHVDRFVVTSPPSVPPSRAWCLADVAEFTTSRGWGVDAEADFDRAVRLACDGAATTLVTGSFHTVGDAMARLQLSPLGR
jgi:dihydrofolate synthase/folylpolyglutamate synthase